MKKKVLCLLLVLGLTEVTGKLSWYRPRRPVIKTTTVKTKEFSTHSAFPAHLVHLVNPGIHSTPAKPATPAKLARPAASVKPSVFLKPAAPIQHDPAPAKHATPDKPITRAAPAKPAARSK